jgi:hypothetical protein
MPSHPRSAWERLGKLLMRRRVDLDPRYQNRRTFVDERAPDRYRIINAIELGRRDNYEQGTIIALEAAYDLAPGAITRTLDGGELEPQPRRLAAVPSPPLTLELGAEHILAEMSPAMRAKTEAHLADLQVTFRTATIIGPSAPGSVIFPGNDHEATRWDRLVQAGYIEKPGEGYTPEEMVTMIAQGRALDDDARAAEGHRPQSRRALTSIT